MMSCVLCNTICFRDFPITKVHSYKEVKFQQQGIICILICEMFSLFGWTRFCSILFSHPALLLYLSFTHILPRSHVLPVSLVPPRKGILCSCCSSVLVSASLFFIMFFSSNIICVIKFYILSKHHICCRKNMWAELNWALGRF